MDADGSNVIQLTATPSYDKGPSWSPDGKFIVYYANWGLNAEVYVMRADGSAIYKLTDHGNFDGFPDWRPDPTSAAAQTVIDVPYGRPATLDGTISSDEWDGANIETFSDGSELLLMHNEGFLYLGIRANTSDMIVGNIFVDHGDEVAILHSSAALGTAIYAKGVDNWQRTQDFVWRCRSAGDSASAQAEREAFLQDEGWSANISYMGSPNEVEYKIAITEGEFRLAATFIPANEINTRIYWPTHLDDDCIEPTPGGMPATLSFSPDQWGTLEISR